MRLTGRLLIETRKLDNNTHAALSYFIKPDKFDVVVEATLLCCSSAALEEEENEGEEPLNLEHPSVALKLITTWHA